MEPRSLSKPLVLFPVLPAGLLGAALLALLVCGLVLAHTVRAARPSAVPAGSVPVLPAGSVEARAPGTLYVKGDASGANNGTSWADAYTNLQSALAAAVTGDEIWVARGVYYPGTTVDDTFQLANGVALYGGFAGAETSRGQRDWQANVTVLSGDIDGNDVNIDANGVLVSAYDIVGDNAQHVVTSSGTDSSAVLDGFVVTAGQADGEPSYGGGMYNENGSPTLASLIFSGNRANDSGGGMYNDSGNPTLTDVTFYGNLSSSADGGFGDGGGMSNLGGDPTLTNVTFEDNRANSVGGGMYNEGGSPTLTDVIFFENFASNAAGVFGNGGGLNNYQGAPVLTNVTFSRNRAAFRGGGMFNQDSDPALVNIAFSGNVASGSNSNGGGMFNWQGSPTLTNVTFSGNRANATGGGINNDTDSHPTLVNTILWANLVAGSGGQEAQIYNSTNSAISVTYSLVEGGVISGTGNITGDPLFVDLNGGDDITGTLDDDLHLLLRSPAIDAGNDSAIPAGVTTDLEGNSRIVGAAVDLGAYESQVQSREIITTETTVANFVGSDGRPIVITVPPGAIPLPGEITIEFSPVAVGSLPDPLEGRLVLAFDLEVRQDGVIQPNFVFNHPLTVTIAYDAPAISDPDELALYYLDSEQQWATDGITVFEPHANPLVTTIAHLTIFALADEGSWYIYLPLVLRDS